MPATYYIDLALFAFGIAVGIYAGWHKPGTPKEARVGLYFGLAILLLPAVLLWIFAEAGAFSLADYLLLRYQPGISGKGRMAVPVGYALVVLSLVRIFRTMIRRRSEAIVHDRARRWRERKFWKQ